jgi:hypothetical protein
LPAFQSYQNVALAEEVEHRPQFLPALGGRAAALLGVDHLGELQRLGRLRLD